MQASIHRRLLSLLLSITTTAWLLTAVSGYHETQHEIEELFDAQLAQSARTLLSVAGHELSELEGIPESTHIHFLPEDKLDVNGHPYEHKLAYQVWRQPENQLIVRSFKAPDTPLSNERSGFSTETINQQEWRIFSLDDPDTGFLIKMGESLAIRNELSNEITLRMAAPMLIALPLLAIFIYFGISKGLAPLKRLTHSIARREPGHLSQVETTNIPVEIEPLVAALNQLFLRVEKSLEGERRFTADAAHELRTPLAALKVQAQVAQASLDNQEKAHAFQQLRLGIERASRLVEQLLTLSRVDPDVARDTFDVFRLRPVAEETMATLEPSASAKRITIQLQSEGDPLIKGQAESIAILLRNLIDNAIRYTPDGGNIEVTIKPQTNTVQISVADSGPGIPVEEHETIFNRFYRLAGQDTEGSGLGLSIVQRIAELHQAQLSLQTSHLGGLEVLVSFPATGE